MTFTVETFGIPEVEDALEDLLAEMETGAVRFMEFLARSTAQRAKIKIRTDGRSGMVWPLPGGGFHQASAPGEPPANLTGRLADSITFTTTGRLKSGVAVGATAPYADVLEFGGMADSWGRQVYLAPRPFLEPSFREAVEAGRTKFREFFL